MKCLWLLPEVPSFKCRNVAIIWKESKYNHRVQFPCLDTKGQMILVGERRRNSGGE